MHTPKSNNSSSFPGWNQALLIMSRDTHLRVKENYFPRRSCFLLWTPEPSLLYVISGVFRRVDIYLTRRQKIKTIFIIFCCCCCCAGRWFEMGKGVYEITLNISAGSALLWAGPLPCFKQGLLFVCESRCLASLYMPERTSFSFTFYTHACFLGWHNSLAQFAESSIKQDLALMFMF